MLTKEMLDNYSLDDWLDGFNSIYGVVNRKRSTESIWLHAVQYVSQLHEDLRIGSYHKTFEHLADLFCWVCAFTVRASIEFETNDSLMEIVLSKFPGICFYCGANHCICSAILGRSIEDLEVKAQRKAENLSRADIEFKRMKREAREPKTTNEIVMMFRTIYDHINFHTGLLTIMAHLQEEVGEVAEVLNNLKDSTDLTRRNQLCEELELEIADIMTWSIALFFKLDFLLGAGKIYLESSNIDESSGGGSRPPQTLGVTFTQIIWDRFKSDDGKMIACPHCGQSVCILELPENGDDR